MINETWTPVPGWEGFYEVSNLGRVRSVDRTIAALNAQGVPGFRKFRGRVLAATLGPNRYRLVCMTAPGRKEYAYVHRLVCAAFLGPCPVGLEVCHADGDRGNNVLSNLRYDTRSANALDAVKHGNSGKTKGEAVHCAKLDDDTVRAIRSLSGFMSHRDIGAMFGVAHSRVGEVIRGTAWKHVG